MINCNFSLCTTNIFGCFHSIMTQIRLVNYMFPNCTMLHIHLYSFKLHIEWCNTKKISAPITMIITTTVGTVHCLNCFSHIIYEPHILIYQNIAKLLTQPSNTIDAKHHVPQLEWTICNIAWPQFWLTLPIQGHQHWWQSHPCGCWGWCIDNTDVTTWGVVQF